MGAGQEGTFKLRQEETSQGQEEQTCWAEAGGAGVCEVPQIRATWPKCRVSHLREGMRGDVVEKSQGPRTHRHCDSPEWP